MMLGSSQPHTFLFCLPCARVGAFPSPISGIYNCKNMLIVVKVGWRNWFAAHAYHCTLSFWVALGWDVPWGLPLRCPLSRQGARAAQSEESVPSVPSQSAVCAWCLS